MIPELQRALAVLAWLFVAVFVAGIVAFVCSIPFFVRKWRELQEPSEFEKEWEERKALRRKHDSLRRVSLTAQPLNNRADAERVAKETEERHGL